MQYAGVPSGSYQVLAQVEAGPSGITTVVQGGNLINTVMITIYQDGNIVQTTGTPYQFCCGQFSPCNMSTCVIQKFHMCNDE